MGREKLRKQRSGRLIESLKMERVRTILTHRYPYPHEHSRHLMIAVFAIWLFFVSSDNLQTLIMKLDKNFKWWSMYIAWIFLAALYHLPSFQSMGLDLRMNLSLFLSIYISSLIFLIVFHVIFLGLWYLGLVSRMAEKKPEMLTIIQNCALASNGSGYSNDISPVYSLWATFIGLYIANYVVERSTGWALTHPLTMSEYEKLKKQLKPDFEDMVPWYSGTSTDLFKTVFDLMVSVTLFVGRFDMRMMQAAMNKTPDESKSSDLFYDHLDGKDELWFDFIADTGDGGNSTYAVARLLAQPSLVIKSDGSRQTFPRGQLLLIGGDLAYPNPSSFSYERRFFCPFEYALQPPAWYKSEHIALEKPELPLGVSELRKYRGPQCFMIPGNHDWFDGLHTFMRYICHKSWLGGWFLPQKRSYFALKLPNGWWVFGLDQALHGDIDVYQFKFFAELCQQKVGESDSVILITHEPNWLLDWYWGDKTGTNVAYLIREYLKGRCKLRMAGDLHHYMRHSCIESKEPVHVQHLLVNGCGGAFLHPTHVFENFREFYGNKYETKVAYPSYDDSSRIALGNILKFRRKNWQFDVIGGFVRRALLGFLHAAAHLTSAVLLMLLMELAIEICNRNNLLATSGYHTLYEWYRKVESEHFPDPTGLRTRLEQWTFGLYPACIKYLMSAFDIPEVMAVTRSAICRKGIESLPRGGAIIYYVCVFLYFWVLSTPVVSLVFGSYLYICINWFHIHFDEAFSSLRIANYKAFTRFHIKKNGDLEVFTLAVDKVPKEWMLDPDWDMEPKEPFQMSYTRKFPSKWRAASGSDPTNAVRVVDHFVIPRTPPDSPTSGSAS
uniref:Calcineurin-like phosphoesterase domain-containing protein n=1 Tax=Oryza punctata TaxID=4537 RepID=A0A0E0LGR2_ORYPU